MKNKSILILVILFVISALTLTACSSSSSSDEVKYADQDFIKSVGKGLDARWNYQYANEKEDTVDTLRTAVQTELDAVKEYQTATFEDSVLQEKAIKYINILNDCLENVEYAYSDDQYMKWSDIYDQRTILIKDFVDNYGLTVSGKNQEHLDELVANGKTAGAQADQKKAIEKLVKDLEFKVTEEEYGWKTYEAVLDNTSDYDIKTLSLDISLLDKDGVIVSTQYANAENVVKGQKAKLKFETEDSFDKYEVVIDYFEAE